MSARIRRLARQHGDLALRIVTAVIALSLVVAAANLLVLLAVGRFPRGDERELVVPALATAALAALLYGAVRARVHAFGERLVRGDRRQPQDVVRTFGDRASRGISDAELLLQLAESLHRAFHPRRAEVWTGTGGWLERTVSVPHQPGTTLRLDAAPTGALVRSGVVGEAWLALWAPELLAGRGPAQVRVAAASHAGQVVGLLVLERDHDDDRFTEDDDATLTDLGRRLGVVLHNRQLDTTLQATLDDLHQANEELRASRARLVAAADSERRRLERDLHDGAQQHLVALAVNLRLAKDLVRTDPDAAGAALDELAAAVRTTIDELRDLAHGIYPPLLRDAGLLEALQAAARRQPQPVRIDGADVGRHPAEVEAAVYFCCLEAFQNAAKHAPGADVVVTLSTTDGRLQMEVSDDGPGFDPGAVRMGQGLQHMSDRLGAVGGVVSWDSRPGHGTTVRASVPLAGATIDGTRP